MVALVAALVGMAGCGSDPSVRQSSDPADSSDQTQCAAPSVVSPPAAGKSTWKATKAAQVPSNQLPAEFGSPYAQPLASLAWEDGIYISRDGLNLYAT